MKYSGEDQEVCAFQIQVFNEVLQFIYYRSTQTLYTHNRIELMQNLL